MERSTSWRQALPRENLTIGLQAYQTLGVVYLFFVGPLTP